MKLVCRYHPSAKLIRTIREVPKFVAQTASEPRPWTRIEVRCSIPGCPWIAEEHDPQKTARKLCKNCGKPLREEGLQGHTICHACHYASTAIGKERAAKKFMLHGEEKPTIKRRESEYPDAGDNQASSAFRLGRAF
jgi:hypothetical protein